jgi:hypothetical protein
MGNSTNQINEARPGGAWRGKARQAGRGAAGHGAARRGAARLGSAGQGMERQARLRVAGVARLGGAGRGTAWLGRQGWERRGKDRQGMAGIEAMKQAPVKFDQLVAGMELYPLGLKFARLRVVSVGGDGAVVELIGNHDRIEMTRGFIDKWKWCAGPAGPVGGWPARE